MIDKNILSAWRVARNVFLKFLNYPVDNIDDYCNLLMSSYYSLCGVLDFMNCIGALSDAETASQQEFYFTLYGIRQFSFI